MYLCRLVQGWRYRGAGGRSKNTALSWRYLSCIAEVYLQEKLAWEGIVLITGLGLAVSIMIASLIVIAPIARGIRVRRLARQANIQRPHVSRIRRFLIFLRRNKSIACSVIITLIFLFTSLPLLLVHILKWQEVPVNPHFILFGEMLAMLNLLLTPLTYAVVINPFRQFYIERLRSLRQRIINKLHGLF